MARSIQPEDREFHPELRGKNDIVNVRLPVAFLNKVASMIEQHWFPAYSNRTDFLRDSIYQRWDILTEMHGDPAIQAQMRLARIEREMDSYDDAVRDANERATKYLDNLKGMSRSSDQERIEQMVELAQAKVKTVPKEARKLWTEVLVRAKGELNVIRQLDRAEWQNGDAVAEEEVA